MPRGATAESARLRDDKRVVPESRVLRVPPQGKGFGIGCDALLTAIFDGTITHVDLPELAKHLTHAKGRAPTMQSEFATIQKGTKERPIDGVAALALAMYGRHSWVKPMEAHAYLM